MKKYFYKKLKSIVLFVLIAILIVPLFSYESGISADEPLAVLAGKKIIEMGGNAVDAAVTIGFVMAVTYPQAGNIGGGGFMIIKMKDKEPVFIDYRETAPVNFDLKAFFDEKGNFVKTRSTIGYLASGVPGTVKGLYKAWKMYGKLDWKTLLQPAIELAEKGFIIRPHLAKSFKRYEKVFMLFSDSKRIFLNNGKGYIPGDRLIQPELAKTLKLIAEKGPDGFYKGEVADKIEKDFTSNGGWITKKDLENYEAKLRKPVIVNYKGYRIILPSLPSSGGPVIAEILNIFKNFNIPKDDFHYYNLLAEAMKVSFFDRSYYMGDMDFHKDLPFSAFFNKEYAKEKAKLIKLGKVLKIEKDKMPSPFQYEKNNTTHFSVVDREGNAVSNTYTLNSIFGSGVIAKGTGVIMNNEIDDFGFGEKNANQFGLITSKYNLAGPGKRMLSSMSPAIVLKDGKPYVLSGAAGGPKIISATIQVILNIIERGMPLKDAAEYPRIHHQYLPDILFVDKKMPEKTVKYLESIGYKVKRIGSIAVANSVLITDEKTYVKPDRKKVGFGISFK